jgi:hypothetical protein
LALGDPVTIRRVAVLPEAARELMIALGPDRLRSLTANLGAVEMTSLADYLQRLSPAARTRFLDAVALEPGRMSTFAKSHVTHAVLGSSDQVKAIDMVLGAAAVLDWPVIKRDIGDVIAGEVHPLLLWEMHRLAAVLAAFGLIFVLLLLRRLLTVPRRRSA